MHRRPLLFAAPALACSARPAAAAGATPLVVVELFTSQGCSSCPPADQVLGELATHRPDVLALSFHVTYWNRLGWRDRFSLEEATDRQRRYAATLGHNQLYTPQAVVQGRRDVVGSNRGALLAEIAAAQPPAVPVALSAAGEELAVEVGEGAGAAALWLVGFDARQVTAVGAGENRGRTLAHANVVRSLQRLGAWQGGAQRLAAARPAGERTALLLQAADGRILGVATA